VCWSQPWSLKPRNGTILGASSGPLRSIRNIQCEPKLSARRQQLGYAAFRTSQQHVTLLLLIIIKHNLHISTGSIYTTETGTILEWKQSLYISLSAYLLSYLITSSSNKTSVKIIFFYLQAAQFSVKLISWLYCQMARPPPITPSVHILLFCFTTSSMP